MESFTLGGCPFCGGTVTAEVKSTQYSNGVPNLLHRAYSVYAACENGCPITRVSRILLHDYVSPADEDSLPVEERRGNAKEALQRSWEKDCETIVRAEPCPRCGKRPLFSLSAESTALRFGCGDTGLAEAENDDTSLAELAGEWNKLVSEVKDDMEYRKRLEDMCAVWNNMP